MLDRIVAAIEREPAVVAALVRQVITLGIAFGLRLSPEQIAAVLGLVELITTLGTRASVTPNVNLPPPSPAPKELTP